MSAGLVSHFSDASGPAKRTCSSAAFTCSVAKPIASSELACSAAVWSKNLVAHGGLQTLESTKEPPKPPNSPSRALRVRTRFRRGSGNASKRTAGRRTLWPAVRHDQSGPCKRPRPCPQRPATGGEARAPRCRHRGAPRCRGPRRCQRPGTSSRAKHTTTRNRILARSGKSGERLDCSCQPETRRKLAIQIISDPVQRIEAQFEFKTCRLKM